MNGVKHVDSTGRGDVAAELPRSNDYDLVIIEAVVAHGEERLLAHAARKERPEVFPSRDLPNRIHSSANPRTHADYAR
jgi:hypothetical protein